MSVVSMKSFLLKYYHYVVFESDDENPEEDININVAEYMMGELENDDLVPENRLFRKIYDEVKEYVKSINEKPFRGRGSFRTSYTPLESQNGTFHLYREKRYLYYRPSKDCQKTG